MSGERAPTMEMASLNTLRITSDQARAAALQEACDMR